MSNKVVSLFKERYKRDLIDFYKDWESTYLINKKMQEAQKVKNINLVLVSKTN